LLPVALTAQLAPAAASQAPEAHYRAFDSKGRAVKLDEIVGALDQADVLIVGETHDDPVAHLLEAELLRRADERYTQTSSRKRTLALSLEMFERDVQTVLDEYLAGFITERHFLLSSRPWKNYETDYRPLVEYAREHHLPVIAANAPARYVSRVSAHGPDSLKELSKDAKSWLPPLPYPPASADYAAKFKRFMQGAMSGPPPAQQPSAMTSNAQANPHGSAHLLEAQALRDASMADRIAELRTAASHQSAIRNLPGRLQERARLGTIAVAFACAIRHREAGVAGFKSRSSKNHTESRKNFPGLRAPVVSVVSFRMEIKN